MIGWLFLTIVLALINCSGVALRGVFFDSDEANYGVYMFAYDGNETNTAHIWRDGVIYFSLTDLAHVFDAEIYTDGYECLNENGRNFEIYRENAGGTSTVFYADTYHYYNICNWDAEQAKVFQMEYAPVIAYNHGEEDFFVPLEIIKEAFHVECGLRDCDLAITLTDTPLVWVQGFGQDPYQILLFSNEQIGVFRQFCEWDYLNLFNGYVFRTEKYLEACGHQYICLEDNLASDDVYVSSYGAVSGTVGNKFIEYNVPPEFMVTVMSNDFHAGHYVPASVIIEIRETFELPY